MVETVVVAGAMAQRPRVGGHTWVFLQYLLGFKRLGWKVLFLDHLEPEMCVSESGTPCAPEQSVNVQYVRDVLERFNLGDSFSIFIGGSKDPIGLNRQVVLEQVQHSVFLLNVMGYFQDQEVLSRARHRVFLDIDPGFGQMWRELGLHDIFAGHDEFVSVAQNIGHEDCLVPTCGLNWIASPPPVVLELWPKVEATSHRCFTSIVTWRGAFGPIEYEGKTYGLRVHEFRKFSALPRLSGRCFEIALDIHRTEVRDIEMLNANGWTRVDPEEVASDLWKYRTFIQKSSAELMIAKGMYVETRGGWLSDRSACYLASGKPVVMQDTYLGRTFPVGTGLVTFQTLVEALDRIEEVIQNYVHHASVARQLAEEYLDSDIVLARLVSTLDLS
jgi:hypothetical protein